MADVIVKTENVHKSYSLGKTAVHALRGVTLDIYRGEYLCIMGPSGSGKSTFFNMVGGLDQPTEGKVVINGVDISKMRTDELSWLRCKTVGYVFQSFNLIDILTAMENVALPMSFVGMDEQESFDKAARILERVGLGHRLHHLPDAVSGGQRQRIAIARALANDPAIILADEPTGNLDIHTGEEIIRLLKELTEESGTTVVTVTHDMKMFDISDRIVWIRDGQIERVADRSELNIRVGGVGGGK